MMRLGDYEIFAAKNIIVIDEGLDYIACDNMSYREWIESSNTHDTTKLEGFEDCNLLPFFLPGHCINMMDTVHVFVTNHTGTSFDWHSDDCHVMIYMLQGNKTIELVDNLIQLETGEHFTLRKGQKHRISSEEGTIALSIGFTGE